MKLSIDKLVFGGQGMARHNGKVVFVWNAIPGETVEAEITKNKKTHLEAVAGAIIVPSPRRLPSAEPHFLACSPWQILSFDEENRWKAEMAHETYWRALSAEYRALIDMQLASLEIVADAGRQYEYRNKMEYSFVDNGGEISLAFFDRGGRRKTAIDGCLLADPAIEKTAPDILAWIRETKIPDRTLKALMLRSNRAGETIAGLFLKDRLLFPSLPALNDRFIGFHLYYSTHKSPASVPTEPLASIGADEIAETILETPLTCGMFSFFQINPPMFERALADIGAHLEPSAPVIDYYSGVGSISLPLANQCKELLLVESNPKAVGFANKNIEKNKIINARALCAPSEHALDSITSDHIVILDPPRAGLHTKVIRALLEKKPHRVIYLSCNLATHARDLAALSPIYRVSRIKLYNFFPRTPHIEGLAILDRM